MIRDDALQDNTKLYDTMLYDTMIRDGRCATYRLCCDKDLIASKERKIVLHNRDSSRIRATGNDKWHSRSEC